MKNPQSMTRIPRVESRLLQVALALSLFLALAVSAKADELDEFIEQKMARAHVPGAAVAVVKDDRIVMARGYGWAHIERGVRVTPETAFLMASVSKLVTATALMQAHDDGGFALDDAVGDHAPVSLENPRHPDVAITFRQLLAHASSIRDNWDVLDAFYVAGDSPVRLKRFLARYLLPGGDLFDLDGNFYRSAPGSAVRYSNVGSALAGGLVSLVGSRGFDRSCRERIFEPLGMTNTGWRLRDMDPNTLAMPYEYRRGSGEWVAYGHYGFPDYPNGLLRSSVLDMARFVIAHMNDGAFGETRILAPGTAREMRRVQYPDLDGDQGLGFYHWRTGGEDRVGHNGGDYGASTEVWFRPSDRKGVLLFVNGDAERDGESGALLDIVERLFELHLE